MPVNAVQPLRRMRGGAQSHLVKADDGHFYVVKFRENPQHRRILVNEWVGAGLLDYLGIAHPPVAAVNFSAEFLAEYPELAIQLGTRRVAVSPGWHFGSRYPADPARLAVYDFLPEVLLEGVANRADFLAIAVVDKWAGNADARQAIFFRARLREWLPGSEAHASRKGFVAQMIDHGYLFDGPNWSFADAPLQGLYSRRSVYACVTSLENFQPWLARVESFPEPVLDQIYRSVPQQWLEGDDGALENLFEKLLSRRKRVAHLLADCRHGPTNPFPNWSGF